MNFAFFVARRLMRSKSSKSGLIVHIAVTAVAISIAVMLIAVAVVKGYQLQITNKITGFSSDIQISRLDFNNSFETNPIYRDSTLERTVGSDSRIRYIQPFAIKAGIIKTSDEFEGIVLKGITSDFHWGFIEDHLVAGTGFRVNDEAASNSIVISAATATKLRLKQGEGLVIYFIQDDGSLPRARKFTISGIYNTGFSDLDALYGIIDLRHIQRLNKWDTAQVSGYEVGLKQYADLEPVSEELLTSVPYHLQVKPVTQIYPQLFDWLGLLDLNVVVIIILMVVVACINMSTALLILIVERSNMIGMLKAMGSRNQLVQRIFLVMSGRLIFKGMLIGNLAGLSVCISQYYSGWIRLDQESYFLDRVPVYFTWQDVAFVNAGAFVLCLVVMLLPVKFVSTVNPVKAIRFE